MMSWCIAGGCCATAQVPIFMYVISLPTLLDEMLNYTVDLKSSLPAKGDLCPKFTLQKQLHNKSIDVDDLYDLLISVQELSDSAAID